MKKALTAPRTLILLLVIFAFWAAWYLITPLISHAQRRPDQDAAAGELMLVIVIAIEGVAAVIHLVSNQSDTEVERHLAIQKELATDQALTEAYLIMQKLPLDPENFHALGDAALVAWTVSDERGKEIYTARTPAGNEVTVPVDMASPLWAAINAVIERWNRLGYMYSRDLLPRQDILDWHTYTVLRMSRRLGSLVHKERQRRKSKRLWEHFLAFAQEAETHAAQS